jgi:hypothetical protein
MTLSFGNVRPAIKNVKNVLEDKKIIASVVLIIAICIKINAFRIALPLHLKMILPILAITALITAYFATLFNATNVFLHFI